MKRIVVLAALAAVGLPAGRAGASGFLAARFGGEHGHPTTSNPTALYYNPAGLALATGTRLYLSGTFAYRTASYDRPADAIDNPATGTPQDAIAANSGEGTLANFLVSPFAGVVSDLGIPNLGVGLGFYVPFGGQSEWDKNEAYEGSDRYPGAVDGVNRWWSIDGTIRTLYFTAGGAYRIPDLRLSLGLGVNLVKTEVHTGRARNSTGLDDMVADAEGTLQEGRSLIDVSGWHLALGAGVIWEPVDNLLVGLSYQSQPGFGEQQLEGTLDTVLGTGKPDEEDIKFFQEIPDVIRLGLRYRTLPWEYRLFGEYVRWSVFESQCLIKADLDECQIKPDGSGNAILNIPRNWEDAFGIRGGVSHWFSEGLEVYVGAGYDSNAAPDEGIDAALMDQPKVTGALGGRFELLEGLVLQPTLTHVYYFEREVDDPRSHVPPSKSPDHSGTYNQAVTALDLALEYTF